MKKRLFFAFSLAQRPDPRLGLSFFALAGLTAQHDSPSLMDLAQGGWFEKVCYVYILSFTFVHCISSTFDATPRPISSLALNTFIHLFYLHSNLFVSKTMPFLRVDQIW